MHFSTLLTTTAMLLCLSLTAPAPSESSEQEPAADDAIPLLITATEVKNYTEGIFGYVSLIEGKGENQQSCNGSLYSVSPPPAALTEFVCLPCKAPNLGNLESAASRNFNIHFLRICRRRSRGNSAVEIRDEPFSLKMPLIHRRAELEEAEAPTPPPIEFSSTGIWDWDRNDGNRSIISIDIGTPSQRMSVLVSTSQKHLSIPLALASENISTDRIDFQPNKSST
ncbi:hypothetical protein G7Y89_g2089 [Cudoniella acicularis]|uniref:Peptidase A1 domain-containing protein n=1 Tax=Cudoniella acicularis TaxID=354080 RepID=A0A8H4W9N6_9HELO|nr:hypothetical protein G7Y89_g2089 [Cudoniella acicularis]